MKTFKLLPLLLLLCTGCCFAKSAKDIKETKTITDSIMRKIALESVTAGVDEIRDYWITGPEGLDAFYGSIARHSKSYEENYGKSIGYDLLVTKTLGKSIIRYTYIQKYEVFPVVWNFTYYQSKNGWNLITANYSDKTEELNALL